MEAGSRAWLDQFPADHRGLIGHWFHEAVRELGPDASLNVLCRQVCVNLGKSLTANGEGRVVSQTAVLGSMRTDPEGARQFMAWVVEREQRSPEERAKEKAAQQQEGKKRAMEHLPPTQKQLDTLLRLGVDEYPANRWEASALIDLNKDW